MIKIKKTCLWLLLTLIITSLLVTTKSINAALKTNKTQLTQRSQAFNIPLETSLVSRFLYDSTFCEKQFLDISPFASFSTNKKKLDEYFLFSHKHSLKIGQGSNIDIDNRYLKFNEISSTNLTGNMELSPRQKTYGLFMNYMLKLDNLLKKLSLNVFTVICNVSSNAKLIVNDGTTSTIDNKTIQDYFSGNITFQEPEVMDGEEELSRTLQAPLEYAKINSSHSQTGVADINLKLSYDFIDNCIDMLRLSLLLTVPTNHGSEAIWLFESRIGTGGHWGLGLGLCGRHLTYEHEDHKLNLIYDIRWQYLFNSHERRIFGLKNSSGKQLNFGQYLLFGQIGVIEVIPAANTIVQNVSVTPGINFEAMLMFSYSNKGLNIAFGYDGWARQAEKVKRKDFWNDSQYAFVGSNYSQDIINFADPDTDIRATANFSLSNSNLTNTIQSLNPAGTTAKTQGFVTSSQLYKEPAISPGAFTNMFFASIGYSFIKPKNLTTIGVGISYEIPVSNTALENVGIWIKLNFAF